MNNLFSNYSTYFIKNRYSFTASKSLQTCVGRLTVCWPLGGSCMYKFKEKINDGQLTFRAYLPI